MDHSILTTALQGGSPLLDVLTGGSSSFSTPADWGYFAFIYDFVRNEIKVLGFTLMARASYYASLVALALVTIWVFYQGLRVLSGKGESIMGIIMSFARVGLIVTAAISMGLSGSAVYDTVGEKMPAVITGYVTDSSDTVTQQIDQSLFAMTVAMKSIDILNVATDPTLDDDKNRALYMVAVGTAGPAVTAGALLLFYQAALALFIGLGPIFILCLIFDQTKDLFRKWLMYGIGTMFSMAILAAMVSISLKAVIAVAASHWATALAGGLTGLNLSSGITSAAMQQGGIGLLLTLLILMVPPMAANFFQGTLGQYNAYSQLANGSVGAGQNAGNQQQRLQTAQGTGQNSNAGNQSRTVGGSGEMTTTGRTQNNNTPLQSTASGDLVPKVNSPLGNASIGNPNNAGQTSVTNPTANYQANNLQGGGVTTANQAGNPNPTGRPNG
jgi:type IV secretion system protein VirB6